MRLWKTSLLRVHTHPRRAAVAQHVLTSVRRVSRKCGMSLLATLARSCTREGRLQCRAAAGIAAATPAAKTTSLAFVPAVLTLVVQRHVLQRCHAGVVSLGTPELYAPAFCRILVGAKATARNTNSAVEWAPRGRPARGGSRESPAASSSHLWHCRAKRKRLALGRKQRPGLLLWFEPQGPEK